MPREGVIGGKLKQLSSREAEIIHEASLELLEKVGIDVQDEQARQIFLEAGAREIELGGQSRISFPANLINDALQTVPKIVKLGARNEENILTLDAAELRSFTGGGTCANWVLEPEFSKKNLTLKRRNIAAQDLIDTTKIYEQLPNVDFCSRCMELEVPQDQKDVNKAYVMLHHTTKHINLGPINDVSRVDDLVKMARIVQGGKKGAIENPLFSFLLCPITNPLRMHPGGGANLIKAVQEEIPVFVGSAPQGGSTSPASAMGEMVQLNAEILVAIALSQFAKPGAKVVYNAMPLMTDFSTGNSLFCSTEAILRQGAGIRLAQYYQIPSCTLAGVADSLLPDLAAIREKFHSYFSAIFFGVHICQCSMGVLGGAQILSFLQMVIDDELLGQTKAYFQSLKFSKEEAAAAIGEIEGLIGQGQTDFLPTPLTKSFAKDRSKLYIPDPRLFFRKKMNLENAHEIAMHLLEEEVAYLSPEVNKKILKEISGILPELNPYKKEGV